LTENEKTDRRTTGGQRTDSRTDNPKTLCSLPAIVGGGIYDSTSTWRVLEASPITFQSRHYDEHAALYNSDSRLTLRRKGQAANGLIQVGLPTLA